MLCVGFAVAACGASTHVRAEPITQVRAEPNTQARARPGKQAFAVERTLGTLYNRLYSAHGAKFAMAAVIRQARRDLWTVASAQRLRFAKDIIRWADQMAGDNSALNGEYEEIEEAFGLRTGDVVVRRDDWMWSAAYAARRINDYDWSNKPAKDTTCVGIWNERAVQVQGLGYFTGFHCEFRQSDGWSNFILSAKSATQFSTHSWASGQIGASSPSRSGGSTAGSGCTARGGPSFVNLVGVGCSEAVNVWFAYANGDGPPDGWSCSGQHCIGPPDTTGLSVSFSWR